MKKIVICLGLGLSLFAFNEADIKKLEEEQSCNFCDFRGADFSNKDLSMSEVKGADFTGANLAGANFFKSDFTGVIFKNTNAKGANFKGTNFVNADISESDFSQSVTWKANFANANISKVDFFDTELGSAIFANNDLSDSNFDGSILWETKFSNSKMTKKQCDHAIAEEAILGTNLNCEEQNFNFYGVFERMMKTKNIGGKVELGALNLNQKNTFAVGALENALGEITIFDGEFFISYGKTGTSKVFKNVPNNTKAMLLASMKPKVFTKPFVLDEVMLDLDFYDFVAQYAVTQNIDTSKPFMFIAKGSFEDVTWHIVNGKNTKISQDGSKQKIMQKVFSTDKKAEGTVFGFFTLGKQGIFTHPGDAYHAHFISKDGLKAGHIDDFSISKNTTLILGQ